MLAIDLFLHRDNHEIGFREAAIWSGIWIAVGLGFGALLLWTAWKMISQHGQDVDPERNLLVRLVRRVVPTSPDHHGGRFFVRLNGRRTATLLFVGLVAKEATDLVFAVDSVAAVLAITTDTFLVWTANASPCWACGRRTSASPARSAGSCCCTTGWRSCSPSSAPSSSSPRRPWASCASRSRWCHRRHARRQHRGQPVDDAPRPGAARPARFTWNP